MGPRRRFAHRTSQIVTGIGCAVPTIVAGTDPVCRSATAQPAPPVIMFDAGALLRSRHAVEAGDGRVNTPYARLTAAADKALRDGPFSVMEKSVAAPSGDKHDYLSLAPYWWPNPEVPGGLPYVQRDGQTNPEVDTIPDPPHLTRLIADVQALTLAYSLSQKSAYAAHAARLLRTWFLHPGTRMNPNLTYAQIRRGHPGPNPFGIIDTRDLSLVVDAVGLLGGSPVWSDADQAGMRNWFEVYLEWLLTSAAGRGEAHTGNHHRTWYDQQVVAIALFLNRSDIAISALRDVRDAILATQIAPDGSQPEELRRTRAWHYSLFNLEPLFRLSTMGRHVGWDLWQFETADGRGVRKALENLTPYAVHEKPWPYKEIGRWETAPMAGLLLQAAAVYGHPAYRELARRIDAAQVEGSWLNLLLYP